MNLNPLQSNMEETQNSLPQTTSAVQEGATDDLVPPELASTPEVGDPDEVEVPKTKAIESQPQTTPCHRESNLTAPEVDEQNEPFTPHTPPEVIDGHIQKPGGTKVTEDKSKDDNGGLGDNSTNQTLLDGKPDQAQHREAMSSELVSESDDQAAIDTQLQSMVEHTIVHDQQAVSPFPEQHREELLQMMSLSRDTIEKIKRDAELAVSKLRSEHEDPNSALGYIWSPVFRERFKDTPREHDEYEFDEGMVLVRKDATSAQWKYPFEMVTRIDGTNGTVSYTELKPHSIFSYLDVTREEDALPQFIITDNKVQPDLRKHKVSENTRRIVFAVTTCTKRTASTSQSAKKKGGSIMSPDSDASLKIKSTPIFYDVSYTRPVFRDGSYPAESKIKREFASSRGHKKYGTTFKNAFLAQHKVAADLMELVWTINKTAFCLASLDVQRQQELTKIEKLLKAAVDVNLWPAEIISSAPTDEKVEGYLAEEILRAKQVLLDHFDIPIPFKDDVEFTKTIIDILRLMKDDACTYGNVPLTFIIIYYNQYDTDGEDSEYGRLKWIYAQYCQMKRTADSAALFELCWKSGNILGRYPPLTAHPLDYSVMPHKCRNLWDGLSFVKASSSTAKAKASSSTEKTKAPGYSSNATQTYHIQEVASSEPAQTSLAGSVMMEVYNKLSPDDKVVFDRYNLMELDLPTATGLLLNYLKCTPPIAPLPPQN